ADVDHVVVEGDLAAAPAADVRPHHGVVTPDRLPQVVDADAALAAVDLGHRRQPVDEAALDEAGEERAELRLLACAPRLPLGAEGALRRAGEVERVAD